MQTEGGMEIVSCEEDGSVLVWRGGELIQSLRHPCCLWVVKSLAGEQIYFIVSFIVGITSGIYGYNCGFSISFFNSFHFGC